MGSGQWKAEEIGHQVRTRVNSIFGYGLYQNWVVLVLVPEGVVYTYGESMGPLLDSDQVLMTDFARASEKVDEVRRVCEYILEETKDDKLYE